MVLGRGAGPLGRSGRQLRRGGLWDPPSFDRQGNLYIGIANPGPVGQTGWPKGYPWGTSRPGPDLYTDSVVKLSPQGKLLWYYQLTPHDLYDWDLEDSPVLTTANGRPVVIDGGKAGILIELNARTGKLLWQLPVGVHSGPQDAGLLTENATPASSAGLLPANFSLEPGAFGGIESQLASDGTTTFAAANNLAVPVSVKGITESTKAFEHSVATATGEVIAVNQDTDSATGAILLKTPLSDQTNAPVTIAGDYVIAGPAVPNLTGERALIIGYRLGADGTLPDTVR